MSPSPWARRMREEFDIGPHWACPDCGSPCYCTHPLEAHRRCGHTPEPELEQSALIERVDRERQRAQDQTE